MTLRESPKSINTGRPIDVHDSQLQIIVSMDADAELGDRFNVTIASVG